MSDESTEKRLVGRAEELFADVISERKLSGPQGPVTFHHPDCRALEERRVDECNCAGVAFPVHLARPVGGGAAWRAYGEVAEHLEEVVRLLREIDG